jgi:hypothetical protein
MPSRLELRLSRTYQVQYGDVPRLVSALVLLCLRWYSATKAKTRFGICCWHQQIVVLRGLFPPAKSGQKLGGKKEPRTHLAPTHPTPLYQHLLTNAGEYKMSGGESACLGQG